jgi:ribonuclease HII
MAEYNDGLDSWFEQRRNSIFAGVDEAGRGPLAGPVIAAAVVMPENHSVVGIDDSKKLTEAQREELEAQIKEQALSWTIGRAEVEEIDDINILHATMLAMKRAVESLTVSIDCALIDGNRSPQLEIESKCVVKGDQRVALIAAASILAKQARDREMRDWDKKYPQYGFAKHKGYPTKKHLEALDEYGICAIHRKTYGPVQARMTTGE